MIIPPEQREQLLDERGITPTLVCDKCGQVLGAVVYTKRGEPGTWCSKECRGAGVKERGEK